MQTRLYTPRLKYEITGELLSFDDALRLYRNSKLIGIVDNGWSSIVEVDNKYYRVQQGLPEYEGNIYMQEIKIIE